VVAVRTARGIPAELRVTRAISPTSSAGVSQSRPYVHIPSTRPGSSRRPSSRRSRCAQSMAKVAPRARRVRTTQSSSSRTFACGVSIWPGRKGWTEPGTHREKGATVVECRGQFKFYLFQTDSPPAGGGDSPSRYSVGRRSGCSRRQGGLQMRDFGPGGEGLHTSSCK